MVFRPDIIARG